MHLLASSKRMATSSLLYSVSVIAVSVSVLDSGTHISVLRSMIKDPAGALGSRRFGFQSQKCEPSLGPGLAHLNFPHTFTPKKALHITRTFFRIANSRQKSFLDRMDGMNRMKTGAAASLLSPPAPGIRDFILQILSILSKKISG